MKKYCPRCGVELEAGHEHCPLCNEPASLDGGSLPPLGQAFPGKSEEFLDRLDQFLAWRGKITLIMTLVLAIPGSICILVDYLYTGLTWAHWVIYSLALVWGLLFIFMAFVRIPLLLFLGEIISLGLFFWALDLTDQRQNWSLSLAVPILLWVALAGFVIWLAVHWFDRKPGFIVAAVFVGIVLVCLGVDLSIQSHLGHDWRPAWSMVVVAALGPLAVLSVIIQVLFLRSVNFRRFFHW